MAVARPRSETFWSFAYAKATAARSHEEGNAQPTEATPDEGEGEESEGQGHGESEGSEGEAAPGGGGGSGLLFIALPGSNLPLDYIDVREDRVVLYGSVGKEMNTFIYKIKATNTGKVVTPAIHAESMYDRSTRARGEPGSLTIVRP